MKKEYLSQVLRSRRSVFTFKDLALIWKETNSAATRKRIYRYVQAGKMLALRRGLYAIGPDYNRLELANKIFSPSYISFETVLAAEGVAFQHDNRIFLAAYLTREILCDGNRYVFRKLKNAVLSNSAGIEVRDGYSIASRERAFLDTLYLNPNYHFDNLSGIDWTRCGELIFLYNNKALAKRLKILSETARNA